MTRQTIMKENELNICEQITTQKNKNTPSSL